MTKEEKDKIELELDASPMLVEIAEEAGWPVRAQRAPQGWLLFTQYLFKGVTLFKLTRSGTESMLFHQSRAGVRMRCEVRAHVCVLCM